MRFITRKMVLWCFFSDKKSLVNKQDNNQLFPFFSVSSTMKPKTVSDKQSHVWFNSSACFCATPSHTNSCPSYISLLTLCLNLNYMQSCSVKVVCHILSLCLIMKNSGCISSLKKNIPAVISQVTWYQSIFIFTFPVNYVMQCCSRWWAGWQNIFVGEVASFQHWAAHIRWLSGRFKEEAYFSFTVHLYE